MKKPQPFSAAKRARLLDFLETLPNAAAQKLFAALEKDRAAGGAGLPHDVLLFDLRAQLIAKNSDFPPRAPTAQRIFFTPFEDFFVLRRDGHKRRGRIARRSLAPIWEVLSSEMALGQAARVASAIESSIRQTGAVGASLQAALFETAAEGFARICDMVQSDAQSQAALIEKLGGAHALADFAELAMLLPLAADLAAMQNAFPRPLASLSVEDAYRARKHYAAAAAAHPDSAPYLLVQLIGRLEKPAQALALHYHFLNVADDELGEARHDAGVVADVLFEDLESAARLLERDADAELDALGARTRINHFADFAEGLAIEASRAGDKAILARIEACREIAAEALARYAEQSLAALRRACPLREARGSATLAALRPDYANPPSPAAAAQADEAAQFLAVAADLAALLEKPSAEGGMGREAAAGLQRYLADLIVEIRAAEGEDRARARRLMERLLTLSAPLLDSAAIDLLKARAAAAAASA